MRLRTIAKMAVVTGMLALGACGGHRNLALDNGLLTQPRQLKTEFTPDSMVNVADQLRRDGHYDQAMSFYQHALQQTPQDYRALRGVGLTLAAVGAEENAVTSLEEAVALQPDDLDARKGLAQVLLKTGRGAKAREQLLWLITRDPRNPSLYNSMGVACDLMGDNLEAQANYSQALAIVPDSPGIRNNLALSFAFSHEFDAAVDLLADMRANPQIRQNLALIYGLAGERSKALTTAMADLSEADAKKNLAIYDKLRALTPREQAGVILLGHPLPSASQAAALDPTQQP